MRAVKLVRFNNKQTFHPQKKGQMISDEIQAIILFWTNILRLCTNTLLDREFIIIPSENTYVL